ncbi:hypothetical protein Tco_1389470, partial [Tanacetum coccineum]
MGDKGKNHQGHDEGKDDNLRKPYKEVLKSPSPSAANQGEWEMPVWCKMFQQNLDGPTRGWFDRMPNGCIDNWTDLRERFSERFALRRRCNKDLTEISAFMTKSKCPELARRFANIVPKTVIEIMKRVDDFVKSKEAYKSTKLPKGEHPKKVQAIPLRGEDHPIRAMEAGIRGGQPPSSRVAHQASHRDTGNRASAAIASMPSN